MAEARKDGAGEALLRRLRRLTAHAGMVRSDDRAKLIALIDDISTVRAALLRECADIDEKLQRAAVRAMAINAYARNRRTAGAPHRRGH